MFCKDKIISTYTRQQAIKDGLLIDVSHYAKEIGFSCSVCITSGAWAVINDIPEKAKYQDSIGRLWDVLNVLRFLAISNNSPYIKFDVKMQHRNGQGIISNYLSLYAVAGGGDNGELVITIMLPDED